MREFTVPAHYNQKRIDTFLFEMHPLFTRPLENAASR